jgi:hypothetical protein
MIQNRNLTVCLQNCQTFQLEGSICLRGSMGNTHHFQTGNVTATVHSSKGISTEHYGGSIEERPDGASGKLHHGVLLCELTCVRLLHDVAYVSIRSGNQFSDVLRPRRDEHPCC